MNLVEIFSSVQGEGTGVGFATLFVRFGGCDLRCRWCDSVETWSEAETCRIERVRGSGAFEALPNPVALADVVITTYGLVARDRATLEQVTWHRVPYDYRETQRKILETGVLSEILSRRLALGK